MGHSRELQVMHSTTMMRDLGKCSMLLGVQGFRDQYLNNGSLKCVALRIIVFQLAELVIDSPHTYCIYIL